MAIEFTTEESQAMITLFGTRLTLASLIGVANLTVWQSIISKLLNNPQFANPDAEAANPVEGISVPAKIDEHGKLPPGCL